MATIVDPDKKNQLARVPGARFAPMVHPEVMERLRAVDALGSHRNAALAIYTQVLTYPRGHAVPGWHELADTLNLSGYIVKMGLRVLKAAGLYTVDVVQIAGRWTTFAVHLVRPLKARAADVLARVSARRTERRPSTLRPPELIPTSVSRDIEGDESRRRDRHKRAAEQRSLLYAMTH